VGKNVCGHYYIISNIHNNNNKNRSRNKDLQKNKMGVCIKFNVMDDLDGIILNCKR
jgi:hypothetical protein